MRKQQVIRDEAEASAREVVRQADVSKSQREAARSVPEEDLRVLDERALLVKVLQSLHRIEAALESKSA